MVLLVPSDHFTLSKMASLKKDMSLREICNNNTARHDFINNHYDPNCPAELSNVGKQTAKVFEKKTLTGAHISVHALSWLKFKVICF